MNQVPLECDIHIAVNGCSWFAIYTQKDPFTAMLISRSRGTYLIDSTPQKCPHCRIKTISDPDPERPMNFRSVMNLFKMKGDVLAAVIEERKLHRDDIKICFS